MADIASVLLDFPPDNVAELSPNAYDKRIHHYLSNLRQLPLHKLAGVSGQDLLDVCNNEENGTVAACCSTQAQLWPAPFGVLLQLVRKR